MSTETMEIGVNEFLIIADFVSSVELPPNAGAELQKKFTDALQVVNTYTDSGQTSPDQGMAAPA